MHCAQSSGFGAFACPGRTCRDKQRQAETSRTDEPDTTKHVVEDIRGTQARHTFSIVPYFSISLLVNLTKFCSGRRHIHHVHRWMNSGTATDWNQRQETSEAHIQEFEGAPQLLEPPSSQEPKLELEPHPSVVLTLSLPE